MNSEQFERLFKKCRSDTKFGEISSLKLMLSYAPRVVKAVYPDLNGLKPTQSRLDHVGVIKLFIKIIEDRFKNVPIFLLTRDNILEVASSRALAQLTQVYHTTEDTSELKIYELIPEDVILDKIMENLPKVVRENRMLHMIKDSYGARVLHIEYDDLANNHEYVEGRVKDYLAGFGLDFSQASFKRLHNKKVVPQTLKDQFIEKFRNEILCTI